MGTTENQQETTELEEFLVENYPDAILIGEDDERKHYYAAIVGFDRVFDRVIYDREKLIECFMIYDKLSYEDATEHVSYNVERSLPYFGQHAPIIMDNREIVFG